MKGKHGTPKPLRGKTGQTADRWAERPAGNSQRFRCACSWSGGYWDWVSHTELCRRSDGNKN